MMEITNILTRDTTLPVLISALTTIVVFFLTLLTKNYITTKILRSKLATEHKFNQRKQIKEALARYKVHLLAACDSFNHRMWNFENKYQEGWLNINGDYENRDHYYFHSFIYRLLLVFAWVKKIQHKMIYLDTTLAEKEDLEFVKFLNVFSRTFCDLTFLEGVEADGNKTDDHFFRNEFELFPDAIITRKGVKSFSDYMDELETIAHCSKRLFLYFDGLTPNEERKRWERLYLFHLTILMFLNNYGYDFQKTNNNKLKKILTIPRKSEYLPHYFACLSEYHLTENKQVKKLRKFSKLREPSR